MSIDNDEIKGQIKWLRTGWEWGLKQAIDEKLGIWFADCLEELLEHRHNLAEHKRLHNELNHILNPKDAPENPSLCDLVAFAQTDKDRNKKLEAFVDKLCQQVLLIGEKGTIPHGARWQKLLSITDNIAKQLKKRG